MDFWTELKSGKFANMVREASRGQVINNSQELFNVLKPLFAKYDDVEVFYVIFLDAKNKVISIDKMFSGSLTASTIYPREIIKKALEVGSAAVILSHNHPSGDTNPSSEDLAITFKVCMALGSVDITLHEHLIVGDGYYSMADSGYIRQANDKYKSCFERR